MTLYVVIPSVGFWREGSAYGLLMYRRLAPAIDRRLQHPPVIPNVAKRSEESLILFPMGTRPQGRYRGAPLCSQGRPRFSAGPWGLCSGGLKPGIHRPSPPPSFRA